MWLSSKKFVSFLDVAVRCLHKGSTLGPPELQRHPLGGSSISRPAKLDAYVQAQGIRLLHPMGMGRRGVFLAFHSSSLSLQNTFHLFIDRSHVITKGFSIVCTGNSTFFGVSQARVASRCQRFSDEELTGSV